MINKRYQLRFTLFMVGLSTVLMVGLGAWVMQVANETTEVSGALIRGTSCPSIPELAAAAVDSPVKRDDAAASDALAETLRAGNHPRVKAPAPGSGPLKLPIEVEVPGGGSAQDVAKAVETIRTRVDKTADDERRRTTDVVRNTNGLEFRVLDEDTAAGATDDGPPRRATVQLDQSSITMVAPTIKVPPDFGAKVVSHWTCILELRGRLVGLERGRLRILLVLIGTGLLLVLGLAIYGIKMTHKVAGPLFKVGLYFTKMRDGRLDKVYNLRKGDQLVDFYDHFKAAHAGVVGIEKSDIERIKAVVTAAEAAGVGDHASITELRELVARKEKSVE